MALLRVNGLVTSLGACALLAGLVRGEVAREADIKAVFLFNFAQFVEWPGAAFPQTNSPIHIAILGSGPDVSQMAQSLQQVVNNEAVRNRKLIVRRCNRAEEVEPCHILYIGPSETAHLEEVLARLKSRPILTVSDMERFARRGGIIQFLTERNKIRLRINLDEAKASELDLSSKLLRLAEVYHNE